MADEERKHPIKLSRRQFLIVGVQSAAALALLASCGGSGEPALREVTPQPPQELKDHYSPKEIEQAREALRENLMYHLITNPDQKELQALSEPDKLKITEWIDTLCDNLTIRRSVVRAIPRIIHGNTNPQLSPIRDNKVGLVFFSEANANHSSNPDTEDGICRQNLTSQAICPKGTLNLNPLLTQSPLDGTVINHVDIDNWNDAPKTTEPQTLITLLAKDESTGVPSNSPEGVTFNPFYVEYLENGQLLHAAITPVATHNPTESGGVEIVIKGYLVIKDNSDYWMGGASEVDVRYFDINKSSSILNPSKTGSPEDVGQMLRDFSRLLERSSYHIINRSRVTGDGVFAPGGATPRQLFDLIINRANEMTGEYNAPQELRFPPEIYNLLPREAYNNINGYGFAYRESPELPKTIKLHHAKATESDGRFISEEATYLSSNDMPVGAALPICQYNLNRPRIQTFPINNSNTATCVVLYAKTNSDNTADHYYYVQLDQFLMDIND